MALADELAAAADLAKGKLAGRPVAVVRGLADLVGDAGEDGGRPGPPAGAGHVRASAAGRRCWPRRWRPSGRLDAYEELVALDGPSGRPRCCRMVGAEGAAADLLRRMLSADLSDTARGSIRRGRLAQPS